ncbi:hypothetical protein DASC09_055580 [Saccharomycopsis crataegensis]|uniref:Transposase n=1 Tax=Saccharomycopsis crataegensis TaxID=43959 RepID=A0AAV5QUN2_9ASCO|nr:hypothetical protein DASC09_055580 [Saccharomycopsis crataegensis]
MYRYLKALFKNGFSELEISLAKEWKTYTGSYIKEITKLFDYDDVGTLTLMPSRAIKPNIIFSGNAKKTRLSVVFGCLNIDEISPGKSVVFKVYDYARSCLSCPCMGMTSFRAHQTTFCLTTAMLLSEIRAYQMLSRNYYTMSSSQES